MSPVQQRTVLVVEDNAALRRAYAAALLEAGYQVSTVSDGESALRLVERTGCFDVAILDYSLAPGGRTGGETGLELARLCSDIAIIFVSGYESLDLPDAGRYLLLRKPVEVEQLLAAVETLIREPPP